jgi:hypothetical protein
MILQAHGCISKAKKTRCFGAPMNVDSVMEKILAIIPRWGKIGGISFSTLLKRSFPLLEEKLFF